MARTIKSTPAKNSAAFKYGPCKTDFKPGKGIRYRFRNIDYLKDEPWATSVRDMLKKLNLPMPRKKDIFRGTHHDMLFLNSHGVVIRIGHLNVNDMVNPAILQPLGWLEDKTLSMRGRPLCVTLHPGVELYRHSPDPDEKRLELLESFMKDTGQKAEDVKSWNSGIVHVQNRAGKDVPLPIMLDTDDRFGGSKRPLKQQRAVCDSISEVSPERKVVKMTELSRHFFRKTKGFQLFQKALEKHNPLREKFWKSFNEAAEPSGKKLQHFWDSCAACVNHTNAAVALYRPWTGRPSDKSLRGIKPLN